jgi:GNAT superfamily N-acetyltransferase
VTDAFVIEVLSSSHDRLAFTSGSEVLDRYLQSQASQDVRRRISNCFVAVPPASTIIAGYYTLAASSIPLTDLPEELANRLPRYPVIPAAIIGRLAVDRQYRRRGLGAALLFDAVQRTMRADPAVFTLIVDAKCRGLLQAFWIPALRKQSHELVPADSDSSEAVRKLGTTSKRGGPGF